MEKVFVDLETIVSNNTRQMTEDMLKKINPLASTSYLSQITDLYTKEYIDHEEYRGMLEEHYDMKDRVLEEVDDKYKGLIDYESIYESKNFNPNMVEYYNKVKKVLKVYIVFYYNTERELKAKSKLCKSLFGDIDIIGMKYHEMPYEKSRNRKRTNKAQYVMKYLGLKDLSGCILVDKSMVCCREWTMENGESSEYKDKSDLEYTNAGVKTIK